MTPELDGGQLRWRYSPPTGPQTLLSRADIVQIKGLSIDGVLGTKSGTLRLFDEQRGLRFEIDLPDSPLGERSARPFAVATSTGQL